MTAGIAAGLARDFAIHDAIRLGAASGAPNVTRHGLASGSRDAIERLAERVELQPVGALGGSADSASHSATPEGLAAKARPH